jgi:hypothetical protein
MGTPRILLTSIRRRAAPQSFSDLWKRMTPWAMPSTSSSFIDWPFWSVEQDRDDVALGEERLEAAGRRHDAQIQSRGGRSAR